MTLLKAATFLLLCVQFCQSLAADATFTAGILRLDSVRVGSDTYEAQLQPVPNASPMAFTVTQARALAPVTVPAATLSGTTLSVPNVLVNGSMRVRATLMLTGQNPWKFQLSSYSVLRAVTLDSLGQTLTPGRVFNINYTGGVLSIDKIKLKIGTTQLQANVLDNVIAANVPAGLSGAQTLVVELDGDSFQLPLAITAGTDIANPKPYIAGYVTEVAASLKSLGLPAALLDSASINSQLASMPEADARAAALQIRENLEPLLAQVNEVVGSSLALDSNSMALTLTSDAECEQWMKRFSKASVATGAAIWVTSTGLAAGFTVPGAIITGVGLASTAIAAEVAVRNMKLIVNYCGALNSATFTIAPLLQSDIVLTTPIEVYESRARTFQLNELFRIGQGIRSSYLSTAGSLKAALTSAVSIAGKLGFSSGSAIVGSLNALSASIKTDDTSTVSTDGHKFSIRSISDAGISGSTVATGAGTLTLLFDKKNEDLAEGRSTSFNIELYNSADGISITVPVKLNGASLLEDLKLAVVGNWTVTNVSSNATYNLQVKAGGTGIYKVTPPNGSCPNGGVLNGTLCDYKMTWSITKSGSKYIFNDSGFWHPGYSDPQYVEQSGLALPVTGFTTYDIGKPQSIGLRYSKQ